MQKHQLSGLIPTRIARVVLHTAGIALMLLATPERRTNGLAGAFLPAVST